VLEDFLFVEEERDRLKPDMGQIDLFLRKGNRYEITRLLSSEFQSIIINSQNNLPLKDSR
jgi:hypothetical protein